MSYISDNLLPNEKVFFTARVHPMIFLSPVLTFIVAIFLFILSLNEKEASVLICLFLFLLFYSILLGIRATIMMLTTEFGVTNRRIIAKSGFIRRQTIEIFLSKIESVSVYQSILGRIFNYGTVTVIGTGGTKGSFQGIANPIEMRKKIYQMIEIYTQSQQEAREKQVEA